MQRIIRDSLIIKSNSPVKFLVYLAGLIKKELLEHSSHFNSSFLYYDREVNVVDCINSLTVSKYKIYFEMEDEIRYLIFNNRQLYWYDVIQNYRKYQNSIHLRWLGNIHNSNIKFE